MVKCAGVKKVTAGKCREPVTVCPRVKCTMHCEYGFKENDDGCPMCECKEVKEEDTSPDHERAASASRAASRKPRHVEATQAMSWASAKWWRTQASSSLERLKSCRGSASS